MNAYPEIALSGVNLVLRGAISFNLSMIIVPAHSGNSELSYPISDYGTDESTRPVLRGGVIART